jgi:hypothetical protein
MKTNATITEIIQKTRQVYQTSPDVKMLVDRYATLETLESESLIETVITSLFGVGQNANRGFVVQAFKKMENCGCGRFIDGRKGYPSRFRWAVNSIALAKAVIGKGKESDVVIVDVPLVKHLYRIRPNFGVTITLPMDITKTEALRLSEWMKTLYFSEEE